MVGIGILENHLMVKKNIKAADLQNILKKS